MNEPNEDDYTVDELLLMTDDEFTEAITEDISFTGSSKSPFQDREVIRRTLAALTMHLWRVGSTIAARAEDPNCSIETYESTLRFRHHLLATIDVTERREAWVFPNSGTRKERAWKQLLHEILDELDGGPQGFILDDFEIPFRKGLSLRDWRRIRVEKDPSRAVPEKAGVVA